eukprot:14716471-Heterocapsa_arctica.AAC.1
MRKADAAALVAWLAGALAHRAAAAAKVGAPSRGAGLAGLAVSFTNSLARILQNMSGYSASLFVISLPADFHG